jgi:hypothetical protein
MMVVAMMEPAGHLCWKDYPARNPDVKLCPIAQTFCWMQFFW